MLTVKELGKESFLFHDSDFDGIVSVDESALLLAGVSLRKLSEIVTIS